MINISSIKAFVKTIEQEDFGFYFEFEPGLNILSGENSSGKSTILSCIYYCLGMEQLASFGNSDGLKECLKTSFKYDKANHTVFSSYTELKLNNTKGDFASIKRIIKSEYNEDTNLISVTVNDGEPEDKFVHQDGDTDHEDGFYTWLSNFSGISIPIFEDIDGSKTKILYLQQIFASSFVEQTKGWSDFFAQIPIFNTKKAKQKIVEYTLGLSGLVEEFELDKLKNDEKEFKLVWTNTIETFQSLISYYNLRTPNIGETFTVELTPTKIDKLELQTKTETGNFIGLSEIIKKLGFAIEKISKKNEVIKIPQISASELTKRHAETSEKLQYLNKEYQQIQNEKVNEIIKRKKYQQTVAQLKKEIEALEGINKINQLKSFNVGAVENCPVCNSSLLSHPDIQLQNVEKVGSVKSLSFFKSEKSLYDSYLANSEDLINRFDKTIAYYEERIDEIKEVLDLLDKQLIDDSRIPSRVDIQEEMRLRFELEKMNKIQNYFSRFKTDLKQIAQKMALLRARKSQLNANKALDEDKIGIFKRVFIKFLNAFGYSNEIVSRIYISLEESNKLFPVVAMTDMPAQPIRLVSSASDFIRAQWAFYMTLLIKAEHHLGILVLDEPGQHAMKSADLIALLKEASIVSDRQLIVAISKENKILVESGDEDKEAITEVPLLKLLNDSGLVEDKDYKLNMINDNSRIDKCIQPLKDLDDLEDSQ
ncbi:AAA family ATPase [Pedobacter sp.]